MAARDAAKTVYFTVEEVGVAEGDVELAARRIGMLVRAIATAPRSCFCLLNSADLVAADAVAELRMRLRQGPDRIAALDHESRPPAVEGGARREARPGQLDEVLDRLGAVRG